jgi:hypothetical protein
MDEPVNRFARELADAIADAVARDPKVEACRQRARASGYEMHVTLEAQVGFLSRSQAAGPSRPAPPPKVRPFEISDSDRRFLRSLRIAVDETTRQVE